MDMDSAINGDNEEQLQVEEADDSCRQEFMEILSLATDIDGSCTTECVIGDCFAELEQENVAAVKQEPDDVCCDVYVIFTLS